MQIRELHFYFPAPSKLCNPIHFLLVMSLHNAHCLSDGKDEPMEQRERVRFLAQGEEIFSVTLHPKAADVFIGNY